MSERYRLSNTSRISDPSDQRLPFCQDEGQSEELDAEATAQAALKDLEVEEPIKLDVEVIQSLGPLGVLLTILSAHSAALLTRLWCSMVCTISQDGCEAHNMSQCNRPICTNALHIKAFHRTLACRTARSTVVGKLASAKIRAGIKLLRNSTLLLFMNSSAV